MRRKNIFEEHPIRNGLGIIGGVSAFLAVLRFSPFEIFVADVITSLIIIIAYFDGRIENIEKHLKNKKYTILKMGKKGLTSLASLIVIILVGILIAFLFMTYIGTTLVNQTTITP